MEELKLDYRLKDGDLNYSFYNDEVAYPYSGLALKYSPYWVRYELGRYQESNNSYYPQGSLFRIPYEISTGTFRPNFIIGPDWGTGNYVIRWKFKKSAESVIEYVDVPFKVISDGISDYSEGILGGYLDLPAHVNVIDIGGAS
jgi:hypothetical protein